MKMNTLICILMAVQTSMSSGKETADTYNQPGYSMAVFVFIAFIFLLIIAVTPVKQNKEEQ